jgi:hypothetical protein
MIPAVTIPAALCLSGWDIALIVIVSVHATALAYLHAPKWKALLLTLPVPFTMASLSLGVRVDTTNVAGLALLMVYTCGVYVLHRCWRAPIIPTIVVCAAGYCAVASLVAPHLPRTDAAFWALAALVFSSGVGLYRLMPPRDEPGHRSPLPVYIKLPMIAAVILCLVIIRKYLQGFMTMFPMVGVVASYEGRHCLWTLSRQIPVLMMTSLPMMAVIRLTYPAVGLGWALASGWVVFLGLLIPITLREQSAEPGEEANGI